jgi:hypothetical protein
MLEPRTEAGVTYPRDNLWLRWNPGPDGSKYDLIVTTANKEVVIQARDLETTDYLIATERLVNVPTGATLSWQVVAHTPQGTTLSSRTFEVLVHASSTIPPGPRQDASSLGIGQIGQALILDSPDFREVFEKTSDSGSALLACNGSGYTMLIRYAMPAREQRYDDEDVVYYAITGIGRLFIEGRESQINLNQFISIPRGTAHMFEGSLNRPLMLLAVFSGKPCTASIQKPVGH